MSDRRRRRTSRWTVGWAVGITLAAVALAILAFVPIGRGDEAGDTSLVGQPAPALRAQALDGQAWDLAELRGRPAWINFWATNCPPCRTEMPAMQRISEEYGDRLTILGVDWGESVDTVRGFVERYAIGYPILLDPALDNYYRWAATDALPRHYFVSADGVVVREVIGPLEPDRMLEIVEELLEAT